MITITFVFWMYVVLFAIIGGIRGWAKELLVAFSVVLAIFIITVLETYVGFVSSFIREGGPTTEFWTRTIVISLLTFFGYQTPNIPRLARSAVREKLQDSLLGIVLGGINGYLIIGSIWHYMDNVGYPFSFISAPTTDAALELIAVLPPEWLGIPAIYFAVAIASTFVVIVFI